MHDKPAASKPETRVLFSLSLSGFLAFLGFSLIVPTLPLYARVFHATDAQIGALVASFGLSRLVFDLPAGLICERINSKKILIIGLLVIVAGSLLAGSATTYEMLFLGRFLEGAGSALFFTGAITILTLTVPLTGRGRAMSIFSAMFLFGGVMGPSLGGYVATHLGLNAPFFAYALLVSLGTMITGWLVEAPRPQQKGLTVNSISLAAIPLILRDKSLLIVNLAVFSLFFIFGGIEFTVVPLFAYDNLQLSPIQVGVSFMLASICNVTTILLAGRSADKLGRRILMTTCLIATATSISLVPFTRDLGQFVGIMILYGVSTGVSGSAFAWASDLAPREHVGTSIGISRTFGDLGLIVGPSLLGYVLTLSNGHGIGIIPFAIGSSLLYATGFASMKARDPIRERSAATA